MADIATGETARAQVSNESRFQRRKQLIQDNEHIREELYKRNLELVETNKTLSLLRTIDNIVLQSQEPVKSVCEQIAQAICAVTGHPLVGLLTPSLHFQSDLELFGWSTAGQHNLDGIDGLSHVPRFSAHAPWLGSLSGSKLEPITDVTLAELANALGADQKDLSAIIDHIPLQSLYLVKLMARRNTVGILLVGLTTRPENAGGVIRLLDRISESVGLALDNKLLFEENKHVLRQLKISNAKLRALDETKDDFISMASHQLRTPLTSVKGYLSMVMEGDAGKLTKTQKNMLGQAFFSSQRMVYLIADLLNVSRLKTGKFIIEAAPVNLAQVVEQELGQLQETAKAKHLTFSYDKPKSFPDLMLDETKIRQVIMNFADNAIYYTPAGGTIKVRLLETPASVGLRIEDDGIGVPKSEQHHLFTKFYRAGNARKARPDGTGLGLFMAKKVIVAEGGALIFESQEGKGSTFGFSFSKSKLAVPAAPAAPKAPTKTLTPIAK